MFGEAKIYDIINYGTSKRFNGLITYILDEYPYISDALFQTYKVDLDNWLQEQYRLDVSSYQCSHDLTVLTEKKYKESFK